MARTLETKHECWGADKSIRLGLGESDTLGLLEQGEWV